MGTRFGKPEETKDEERKKPATGWNPVCGLRKVLAPRMCRSTNRQADPEVWFRIVHLANNGPNDAPVAAYREQMVEIALGPKGAFENGNIGTFLRRARGDRVVSALPSLRGNPKPPKQPRPPRVVELLRKAIEWDALLESGKITSQAKIARKEGITRARVTHIMGLLRLVPQIKEQIQSIPDGVHHSLLTERMPRPITAITGYHDQNLEFQKLLG
jgi:hypothetical protein